MTPRILRPHPSDTVEVAIDANPAGTVAAGRTATVPTVLLCAWLGSAVR